MKNEIMLPLTLDRWTKIEEGFRIHWHFSNCIGALDSKDIMIKSPAKSGSLFFNYKGHFSTNLMALVEANYRFIFVDIGEYGSNSDGSVFKTSNFGKKYMNHQLGIPGDKMLPNYQSDPVPHVVDEGFPLLPILTRPYPKADGNSVPREEAIFNFRLSSARMVVENAFGIFSQRWHLFDRRIPLEVKHVDVVVQACVCLHNFVVEDKPISQMFAEFNPEARPYLCQSGMMRNMPRLPARPVSDTF